MNLAAVAEPKTFIEIVEDDGVVAVGFVVASGPWIGACNMATVPACRRRGAATLVLRAAADGGPARGCRDAHLQVHPDNAGARGPYASLGFATHHVYTSWVAPS